MEFPTHIHNTFEQELIAELKQKAKVLSFKAGETILEIGQPVRMMPVILSGTIKVSRLDDKGRELLLYYVTSTESCAMTFTCCMQHYPSEIRAVAEDDVELLAVPVSLMDEWLIKYPTWKSFVMKTIRNRFSEMLRTIDQIAFQKLDERLINYLKDKSKSAASNILGLSHEQVANDLATSRVVISRLLKKLENEKKVLLKRNQIEIISAL